LRYLDQGTDLPSLPLTGGELTRAIAQMLICIAFRIVLASRVMWPAAATAQRKLVAGAGGYYDRRLLAVKNVARRAAGVILNQSGALGIRA